METISLEEYHKLIEKTNHSVLTQKPSKGPEIWTSQEYQEFIREQKQHKKRRLKDRKNKFNNKKTLCDGIWFDSQKEADYYIELKQLKQVGKVKRFDLQPKYLLQDSYLTKNKTRVRAIVYIADFEVEYTDSHIEVVDTKGYRTEVFNIKKKLFEKKYPDKILKVI